MLEPFRGNFHWVVWGLDMCTEHCPENIADSFNGLTDVPSLSCGEVVVRNFLKSQCER